MDKILSHKWPLRHQIRVGLTPCIRGVFGAKREARSGKNAPLHALVMRHVYLQQRLLLLAGADKPYKAQNYTTFFF